MFNIKDILAGREERLNENADAAESFKKYLDERYGVGHCSFRLSNNQVTLLADSGALASQLHITKPEVQQKARVIFGDKIERIRIIIAS